MIKLLIMKKVKDVKGLIYSYTRERISHNCHCSWTWGDRSGGAWLYPVLRRCYVAEKPGDTRINLK